MHLLDRQRRGNSDGLDRVAVLHGRAYGVFEKRGGRLVVLRRLVSVPLVKLVVPPARLTGCSDTVECLGNAMFPVVATLGHTHNATATALA